MEDTGNSIIDLPFDLVARGRSSCRSFSIASASTARFIAAAPYRRPRIPALEADKMRKELRLWLREMHGKTRHMTVFLTHDPEEALERCRPRRGDEPEADRAGRRCRRHSRPPGQPACPPRSVPRRLSCLAPLLPSRCFCSRPCGQRRAAGGCRQRTADCRVLVRRLPHRLAATEDRKRRRPFLHVHC